MNLKFAKYLIIILLLASCGNQENEIKNYGFPNKGNESSNVSLELLEFKNYGKLIDRIHGIVCNDSVPKIPVLDSPPSFPTPGELRQVFQDPPPFFGHTSKKSLNCLKRINSGDTICSITWCF